MGKRTAESMRHLESKAREAQKQAVDENDTPGAIYESQVAAEYGRRAAEHEKSGAKGW
jgi:hypothetical protein